MSAPTVGEIFCSPDRRYIRLGFCEQIEPVILTVPVVPAEPPPWGQPCLVPALVPRPPDPRLVPALVPRPPDPGCPPVNKVRFSPVPATKLRQNQHRTVQGSPPSLILWLLQRRPSSSSCLQSERTQRQRAKLYGSV